MNSPENQRAVIISLFPVVTHRLNDKYSGKAGFSETNNTYSASVFWQKTTSCETL